MRSEDEKPLIGVSQCLLGDAVRYDGQSKANLIVTNKLSKLFRFIAVCPELEAGLGVPRAPVQLTASVENPELTGRDDPTINISGMMQPYCQKKVTELNNLSGFILKSRSPSCGLNSTPVYINGRCASKSGRGIFAKNLRQTYPQLALIEDSELSNKQRQDQFIEEALAQHNMLKDISKNRNTLYK